MAEQLIESIDSKMKDFTLDEIKIVYKFVDFLSHEKENDTGNIINKMREMMKPIPWDSEDDLMDEMSKDRVLV